MRSVQVLSKDMPLEDSIKSLQEKKFTGTLSARSQSGLSWKLYFGFGELIWIDGGCHPNRASLRNFRKYCANIDPKALDIPGASELECSEHFVLTTLLQSKKLALEQLQAFIPNKIAEDLFDILQYQSIEQIAYESDEKSVSFLIGIGLRASLVPVNIEGVFQQARSKWSSWQEQGYASWSPNMAPVLEQKEKLQQVVSEAAYQNLVRLVDGSRTLRDLSVQMGQEAERLVASLLPFIRGGYIKLVRISDLEGDILAVASLLQGNAEVKESPKQTNKPLVACIDDSPQICKIMQLVLTGAGYDFIGIQDSLTTVSTFIQRTPDLIFLDLNMPVVNGYEVCSQLRRVAKLKDIPIVILTGNDGIVDRVRSKVVGASGFMSKPIDQDKVISTVRRMLAGDDKVNNDFENN